MKNIILFCFLLSLQQNSFAQKSKIAKILMKGSWELHTVDGKAAQNKDLVTLQFDKNGILNIAEQRNSVQSTGIWSVSDDGKKMALKLFNEEPFSADIISIEKKSMTLDRDGSIAVFSNVKSKKPESKAGKSKNIVGTWKIIKVTDQDVESNNDIIQFNEDGTAWSNRFNYEANWEIKENKLITTSKYKEEIVNFSLSKDKKTLTILDRNDIIILKRINEKLKKPEPEDNLEDNLEEIEPEIVENGISEKDLIGTWNVTELDNDKLLDRVLIFELNADMKFSVFENGTVARSGNWELKKGRLYLKDADKNNSDYKLLMSKNGQLILTDYYGTINLQKQ